MNASQGRVVEKNMLCPVAMYRMCWKILGFVDHFIGILALVLGIPLHCNARETSLGRNLVIGRLICMYALRTRIGDAKFT